MTSQCIFKPKVPPPFFSMISINIYLDPSVEYLHNRRPVYSVVCGQGHVLANGLQGLASSHEVLASLKASSHKCCFPTLYALSTHRSGIVSRRHHFSAGVVWVGVGNP